MGQELRKLGYGSQSQQEHFDLQTRTTYIFNK